MVTRAHDPRSHLFVGPLDEPRPEEARWWWAFKVPGGTCFTPAATLEDAHRANERNAYDGAPPKPWPWLGYSYCGTRDGLRRFIDSGELAAFFDSGPKYEIRS